ncbi:MAG: hypothetical protein PUG74_10320 [Prevotellaceae bacterium]|nr:hypothetical protein [Prevotellaceae bacterium]
MIRIRQCEQSQASFLLGFVYLQGELGTISRRFRPNPVKKEGMELEEDFFRQKAEIITSFQEGYSVK